MIISILQANFRQMGNLFRLLWKFTRPLWSFFLSLFVIYGMDFVILGILKSKFDKFGISFRQIWILDLMKWGRGVLFDAYLHKTILNDLNNTSLSKICVLMSYYTAY